MDKLLTKSGYLRGTTCTKSLYLDRHKPELREKLSDSEQKRINDGMKVGVLAQELFPMGKLLEKNYSNLVAWANSTKNLIEDGQTTLYEAGFIFNDLFCAVDILVKEGGAWRINEVKSSTELKDHFIEDAAFQYHVLTNAGMQISDVSIVYINKDYVRTGAIEPEKLFTVKSILSEVKAQEKTIEELVPILKGVVASKEIPKVDIGLQCHEPNGDCEFMSYCWKHIPENSVFDIARLSKKKKIALYTAGILDMKDIPEDFELTENHQIQVDGHVKGKYNIDKTKIKMFLSTFQYPCYHFDIETFAPPIPMFDKSSPYTRISFQFSLHYKQSSDSDIKHTEFLADPKGGDPRLSFIRKFLSSTETKGSILVYNIGFERSVLLEIGEAFPEYAKKIQERIDRMIDLALPFQSKIFYLPSFKGSYSIKHVLPAMVPGFSYQDLEIQDGMTASNTFEALYEEHDKNKIEKAMEALMRYCGRDTEAMVRILQALEKAVE